ncbi:MAG: hypothetical protein KIT34_17925 [Cyanobacteria bacterium TGS_CYA1]|nr:hypothetical protein [Cyanobacteria bacterium TGS_CYA1]
MALKKQIDALQKEKEELGTTAQKAAELEKEIEILKAPWWKSGFPPLTNLASLKSSTKLQFNFTLSERFIKPRNKRTLPLLHE